MDPLCVRPSVPQDDFHKASHVGFFGLVGGEEGMLLRKERKRLEQVGRGVRAPPGAAPGSDDKQAHHEFCVGRPLFGNFLQAAGRKSINSDGSSGCCDALKVRPKVSDPPLRGEVHKLRGEGPGGQLGRRLLHHLLQLLEGRPPRVVREAQDGELDLRRHRNSVVTSLLV